MNLSRIYQYVQRFINVYLYALPGGYQERRLQILRQFFVVVNDYMQRLEVDYWVDFGTLLGFYREDDILPHDIDVDFGAHETDFLKVWNARHLLPAGFTMYDTSFRHNGPKLYVSFKGFDADIYFYSERTGYLRSPEKTRFANLMQDIPKGLIYPLKSATFLETATKVPADAKAYLEFVYGYIGCDAVRNTTTGFWSKK